MRSYARALAFMGAVLTIACAQGESESAPAGAAVPLFDNLGSYHREISSEVVEAQSYFDQGLRLTYGFNHDEAIRAFEEATRLDPSCAICYWGIAYALGPNINAPMDPAAVARAHETAQKAVELSANASEVERALIDALAKRYSPDAVFEQ